MSGRRRDALDYYKDIPHLGISAENGSFLKFTDRHHWIPMSPDIDVSWKKAVNEIFEYYTDRTPGSYIEQKETSVVWHFGLADQNFGAWQALECSNHIQNALGATYSIHPVSKKKSVEVMPRNVNKGIAVRRILEHHQGRKLSEGGGAWTVGNSYASPISNSTYRREMPTPASSLAEDPMSPEMYYASPKVRSVSPTPGHRKGWIDFIFCIGDDRQDEYMFEHLMRHDARIRSHSSGNESVSPLLSESVTPVNQEMNGSAVMGKYLLRLF
jgi:trehalose-6-phosphatase